MKTEDGLIEDENEDQEEDGQEECDNGTEVSEDLVVSKECCQYLSQFLKWPQDCCILFSLA
jgi:hypothetical protein